MCAEAKEIPKLIIQRRFDVPCEKVFEAWTRPEALERWFAPCDTMGTRVLTWELNLGGRYRIRMSEQGGKEYVVGGLFRDIDPPNRLVFTWAWEPHPDETPLDYSQCTVTVELRPVGDGTELTLIHERLPNEAMRTEHQVGWEGCLDRLAQSL